MGRVNRTSLGVAVCVSVAVLTACAAEQPAAPEARTSDQESDPTSAPAAEEPPDSPLAGSWISYSERGRAAKRLEAAGLGKWTEDFFDYERWPQAGETMTAVYSFMPGSGTESEWEGSYEVAYFEADRDAWHVGWWGPGAVKGRTIEMYDSAHDYTDVYRWRVRGDELTLRRAGGDKDSLSGFPLEVFDVAYLTDPLVRTDCPMDPGVDCPA